MKIDKRNKNKKIYIIILIALVVLSLLTGGYFFFFKKSTPPTSTTQTGQKVTSDPNVPGGTNKDSGNEGITTDKNGGTPNPPKPANTVKPTAPLGVFVSNHHPNLSGTSAPNSLSSTCTTTPSVNCKIQFTKDGTVKELPAKKTDANGNTQWDWTLQEIGLTQGTWQITAVAVNGDLTTTSNDAMALEVRP